MKEDIQLVKKKAPIMTDEQIDDLLNQFGTYSKDGSVPNESDVSADSANNQTFIDEAQKDDILLSDKVMENYPADQKSNTERSTKVKGHQTALTDQSKPTFRILVLSFLLVLSAWLLPSANVSGLRQTSKSAKDRDSFFSMSSQHLMSDSLKEVHSIPHKYILEMSETLTPAPDESKFEEKFDSERKNFDGAPIYYYCDDSIEVKCWREQIDDNIFNFSEIWISDPSQLRRTLVDNVISKKHLDHPQNIFAKTNGIVGMSADYCAFRSFGIIIQYGNVVRNTSANGTILDIAVYDTNGNFSACDDNKEFFETDVYKSGKVIHTFAFGPVLVDNYAVSDSYKLTLPNRKYPGELNDNYPRAAICQFGYDKHYLLCTVDYHGLSAKGLAEVLQSKGVRFAYNLDGGQTATLMFNKKIINKVAYGGTRQVSDILYFATAIPDN